MSCLNARSGSLGLLLAALLLSSQASAKNDGIETAGNVVKFALPVAGVAIALYRNDDDGALQLGVSWVGAYGVSLLFKQFVHEERPDHMGHDSFPSDSTATAFAAATSLQVRYGWDYGLPAYALATFVGVSRVAADKHHWHDVAAGALIGWAIGELLTDPYQPFPEVQAYADSKGAGFNAHWRW
jgi:membrane-associated phospholipid phosphatase